jgi:hypothetical protein
VPLLSAAVAEAGGYDAACRLAGLEPDGSRDRAEDFSNEELTLRRGIRTVLRESDVAGSQKGRDSSPQPSSPNFPSSDLARYLYWME